MASLNILCSNLLNLKDEIMKIEYQKTFCGPSKIKKKKKYFMAHQYMSKIMTPAKPHDPLKNPPPLPPTYLMYGP